MFNAAKKTKSLELISAGNVQYSGDERLNKKQHVIIFDGPDVCGKTEMAKELSRLIKVPYFKNENEWKYFEADPNYFKNALSYGDTFFYSYLKQTCSSVILDRSYPSEWVYSKAFLRVTNEEALKAVDTLAYGVNTKIIIPYRTSYDGLEDQFSSITPSRLDEIEQLYREFIGWTSCDTLLLNVDAEDLDAEIFQILKFVNGKED